MTMAAVAAWAANTPPGQTALVILVAATLAVSMAKIWERDFCCSLPFLTLMTKTNLKTPSVSRHSCVSAQLLKLEQLGIKLKNKE